MASELTTKGPAQIRSFTKISEPNAPRAVQSGRVSQIFNVLMVPEFCASCGREGGCEGALRTCLSGKAKP